MPVFEETETREFRCTVLHLGRRLSVTLPWREHYTVEQVLTEASIDPCGFGIRRNGSVISVTEHVFHGHVIEVVRAAECVTEEEIIVRVVAFGQPHEVRLPRRDGSYTVEEVLRHSPIRSWDGCQFRCNRGITIETTTVVEHGQVIYVLTKIRGNA